MAGRAVVTGAFSYSGSVIARQLIDRGFDVVSLSRRSEAQWGPLPSCSSSTVGPSCPRSRQARQIRQERASLVCVFTEANSSRHRRTRVSCWVYGSPWLASLARSQEANVRLFRQGLAQSRWPPRLLAAAGGQFQLGLIPRLRGVDLILPRAAATALPAADSAKPLAQATGGIRSIRLGGCLPQFPRVEPKTTAAPPSPYLTHDGGHCHRRLEGDASSDQSTPGRSQRPHKAPPARPIRLPPYGTCYAATTGPAHPRTTQPRRPHYRSSQMNVEKPPTCDL
jgi:hypothetical protein